MVSWQSSSSKYLHSPKHGDSFNEEPTSLRRLRESLSHLEQLERQRNELRNRFEDSPALDREFDGLTTKHGEDVGARWSASPQLNLGIGNRSPPARTSTLTSNPARTTSWAPATAKKSAKVGSPKSPAPLEVSGILFPEKSQERINTLQHERDEARQRLLRQEAEVHKLTVLMQRSEAEQRVLLEERQRDLVDAQRLRRELREAHDQLAALRGEAQQSRSASEEWRSRLEQLLSEQRQQIERLEEKTSRLSRDLAERSRSAVDFGEALFACISERTALLYFVVDLLTALQSLFYDPTPFAQLSLVSFWDRNGGKRGGTHNHARRPLSQEPSRRISRELPGSRPEDPGAAVNSAAASDIHDVIRSLEAEISRASQEFSAQVQRVVAEAEQASRAVGIPRGREIVASEGEQSIFRACAVWVEQERQRRDAQGLPPGPVPCVDWAEERSKYHATTRCMETKFAQLGKLRRLLEARSTVSKKKPLRA